MLAGLLGATAYSTTTSAERPEVSTKSRGVEIPNHYPTLQEAIDTELAFIQNHHITFRWDGHLDEDVVIPVTFAQKLGHADEERNPIVFRGGSVESIFMDSVHGSRVAFKDVEFTGKCPYDSEDAALHISNGGDVVLDSVTFCGDFTGVLAYNANVFAHSGVHFECPGNGVMVKHFGRAYLRDVSGHVGLYGISINGGGDVRNHGNNAPTGDRADVNPGQGVYTDTRTGEIVAGSEPFDYR